MRCLLFLSILLSITILVQANEFDFIISTALEHDNYVLEADKILEEAEKKYKPLGQLLQTSLSVTAGYQHPEKTFDVTGTLTLPILPFLSVSASLGTSGTASVDININPFSKDGLAAEGWSELRQYRYNAAAAKRDAALAGISFYFQWKALKTRKTVYLLKLQMQETALKKAEHEFSSGLISNKEYLEVSEQSREIINKELEYKKDLLTLEQSIFNRYSFNPFSDLFPEMEINLETIVSFISEFKLSASALEDEELVSAELAKSLLDLEQLNKKQRKTAKWQPDLTLGSSYDFNSKVISGSLSLSISPAQFTDSQWSRNKREIIKLEEEISKIENNLIYEKQLFKYEIGSKGKSMELQERKFLLSRAFDKNIQTQAEAGEVSRQKQDDSRLALIQSRHSLYESAANLFQTLYKYDIFLTNLFIWKEQCQ